MTHTAPGFYGRLARWVLRHRAATVLLVALFTIVTGAFTTKLRIDSDILALMPQDEPSTQALERLDKQEGGINFLTITVDADDATKRDAFLKDLSARLEKLDTVSYVLYDLEPDLKFRLGLLHLDTADLTVMRDHLKGALSLGPALTNPFMASRLLDLGPLTKKLEDADQPLNVTSAGRMRSMLVRPKGSAHDLPFARKFMAEVDAAIVAAGAKPPEQTAEPSLWQTFVDDCFSAIGVAPQASVPTDAGTADGVTIEWVGGAYRHNVEDYEGIIHDIGWITAASFLMVLAIIGGAFRTPRAVAIIFIPLTLSNIWTLGIAGGTVGALNTFTSFVNAILIGLGVEFGVHMLARVRELRAAGHSVEDSIIRSWDLVGGACTSAAFTSSAGFAALLAAHFAGFRQLGWLLCLGLLLCLIGELVCMPVLISWLEKDTTTATHHAGKHRRRRRPASYRLAPVGLVVIASITVVSALMIRIRPEYDLTELRRAGLAYEDLSETKKLLAREAQAPVVVSYKSAEDLDAAAARVAKLIADKHLPEVRAALSVRTVIPADQDARLALLREIAALGNDPNAVYLPPQVRANLARVQATPLTPLTAADLPDPVQHVLGANDGNHRLLLFPSGNMSDMREATQLSQAIQREFKGDEVAGESLTLAALYDLMKHDAPIIGMIAFALVVFFTAMDLRELRSATGAIAVLLAGVAWWGALLSMSNIKISIVNFVGIPIVLGIGIDVMIHLIHRMKQEGPGRIQKALATTGWASALGTSTTVVAFAALSLASSQGVRSLGLLVLLGESSVTVAGFLLVPLGFATAWRLQGRHPAASGAHLEDTNPGTS